MITIALNLSVLYAMDFKYAVGNQWLLVIAGILVIPNARIGAYIYQKLHPVQPASAN